MSVIRRVISAVGSASLVAIGGAYYFRDDLRSLAATVIDSAYHPQVSVVQASSNGYFSESYVPLTRWNKNWDNREPMSLLDDTKFATTSDEEKAEMLKKVKPTATRHIFLIRHGQYLFHDEKQKLTELGCEQALLLGKRLALSKMKFDRLIMSTMTRATETAQIALTQLEKSIPTFSDSMLEEGAPYPPEPPHYDWRPKPTEFFVEGSRIEAAFRKYIHRASPNQKEDSYEVIVCHGNVIRYFICRALQFPPEGWLRIALGHTSISWLTIRPNGYVSVRALGDIGHLPPDKATFS